jgi:hypothetical protein
MNADSLKLWLNNLISCYREKVASLSPEERSYIVYNLDQPCQVHALWSANNQSQSNYQVLIFTHLIEKPDLCFNIFGPFEPCRFSESAAKLLSDSLWDHELPQDDYSMLWERGEHTYRDILIRLFRGFTRSNERYFTQRALLTKDFPNNVIASKQMIYHDTKDFLWEIWGNLQAIVPEQLVSEDLKDARTTLDSIRNNKANLGQAVKDKPLKKLPNYGTLLFPPIWIGEMPKQSIEDQIQGKHVTSNIILNAEYENSRIILRQDGFLAVKLPDNLIETQRTTRALEVMNELVASLFLLDVPLEVIREHDLVQVTINLEAMRLGGMSWDPERLRRPIDNVSLWGFVDPASFPFSPGRANIPEQKLQTALQITKELSSDVLKENLSSLILEAFTLFKNAEYSQSFLSSWLILETHLGILWNDYIKSKNIAKPRADKLKDSNRWSVNHLLETLNLACKIDSTEYEQLMNWKTKRNKVVHEGVKVTDSEAKQCIELAAKVVRNLLEPGRDRGS